MEVFPSKSQVILTRLYVQKEREKGDGERERGGMEEVLFCLNACISVCLYVFTCVCSYVCVCVCVCVCECVCV